MTSFYAVRLFNESRKKPGVVSSLKVLLYIVVFFKLLPVRDTIDKEAAMLMKGPEDFII
jgi:hypothetical protein